MFLDVAASSRTTASLRQAIAGQMGAQVAVIAATLREGWEIDRLDSDDDASLLLTPETYPQTDTAFLVEVSGQRFALSVLHDDRLEFQGSYGSVETMVSACMVRLALLGQDRVLT